MWDDQPIHRKPPPVDMPPSARAFLSQFNRSFTPPALINDPYAVDRKLVITPLLLGSRPLYVSRNPYAVDPAIERVRHYVGCEETSKDVELRPSPKLAPLADDDWHSDEEYSALEKNSSVSLRIPFLIFRSRMGISLSRMEGALSQQVECLRATQPFPPFSNLYLSTISSVSSRRRPLPRRGNR
jgi:hypothetical protein